MANWMISLGAAAAALFGFAWLALAMPEHQKQVYGTESLSQGRAILLRLLAVLALLGSGTLCFLADRPSMAVLVWIMLMALSATLITLTLAWKPALLRLFSWDLATSRKF